MRRYLFALEAADEDDARARLPEATLFEVRLDRPLALRVGALEDGLEGLGRVVADLAREVDRMQAKDQGR